MNSCSTHHNLHCCHKIQAWVQHEYIESRNRSPYRQRSFQKTLRTYAAPIHMIVPKNKSLSTHGIKESRLSLNETSKENIQSYSNKPIEKTPIDCLEIAQKQQSLTKDKITFKETTNQNQSKIQPFDCGINFSNDFEKITLDNILQNQSFLTQLHNQRIEDLVNQQNINFQTSDHICAEMIDFSDEKPSKKNGTCRKFSFRLIKRQFKHLWSKNKLEELAESIIRTRDLTFIGEESEIKAKLYSLLLHQLP